MSIKHKEEIDGRKIIGLYEVVHLLDYDVKYKAKIDTGATRSSIDLAIAAKLRIGPIIGVRQVKNANGVELRPVVNLRIKIAGEIINGEFTLADRARLTYPILIGQDVLKQGKFLIDVSK